MEIPNVAKSYAKGEQELPSQKCYRLTGEDKTLKWEVNLFYITGTGLGSVTYEKYSKHSSSISLTH